MKVVYGTGAPSMETIVSPEWRNYDNAEYAIFGDSNVHLTNSRWIHERCMNDALGGSTPKHTIERLKYWNETETFKGVYIQTGGNRWGDEWLQSIVVDSYGFMDEMYEIIERALCLCDDERKIIIASLPWIHPDVTIGDWPSAQDYPKDIKKSLNRIKANDLFEVVNDELRQLCNEYHVVYYDVFKRLRNLWNVSYENRILYARQPLWFDKVHYGNKIRYMICQDIKRLWGI